MISQEEIGFQPSRESGFSPPKPRASVQAAAAASGGLIYDPSSGSLRYPKFTQLPAGLKSEKLGGNVAFPVLASAGPSVGKGSSSLAGEKHNRSLNAHGGPYDQQSADSSPRCVISNSTLESSTSTSPSGSKSVSEMDDYSDVKQLITHNRSSSPSDADDDGFFESSNNHKGLKSSGFRPLEASRGGSLDNPLRQKNLKGTGELVQKIFQVTANHSRSISTSAVPGIDSFQKLVVKDHGGQQPKLEISEIDPHHAHSGSNLGSMTAMSANSSSTDVALLDPNGAITLSKTKLKGIGSSFRGSQSHELLSMNENGWGVGEHDGRKMMQSVGALKNSPLDPVLESLMKASIAREGSLFKQQQNQIADKIEEMKRKNAMKASSQNNSFSHGGAGAFSFNQTHVVRVNDADFLDYDSNYDTTSNSSFDFCRGGDIKGVHRTVLNNLTKPAPSKWDDAEKWLSSEPPAKTKAKSGPLGHPLAQGALALSKKAAFLNQAGRLIPNISQLAKPVNISICTPVNCGSDASSSAGDVGMGNNDGEEGFNTADHQRSKDEKTKKIDSSVKFIADTGNQEESRGGTAASRFAFMPTLVGGTPGKQSRTTTSGSLDRYPLEDLYGRDDGDAKEACTSPDAPLVDLLDPALRTEKPTSDSPSKEDSSNLDSATAKQLSAATDAVPKVCMRDMGTAMTPIASVEPSRAATPVCARTPSMRSPSSSRPATPSRVVPTSSPTCETERKVHYTDKELQSKTRQEILALGTQLGKHNIAAWATKEEEEEDAFKSLKNNVDLEEVRKVVIATRAAAWEEAEQAKYLARYKREEAKIQAWENHERAKAEADMRRIEMKIERMRSHANEKLMNKLAATRRSAEELRAAAAARRGEQASKTSERAEYIRRTGKVPGSIFASLCCS